MPEVLLNSLKICTCLLYILIYKFPDIIQMVFDRIEQKWFRYLIINVHNAKIS